MRTLQLHMLQSLRLDIEVNVREPLRLFDQFEPPGVENCVPEHQDPRPCYRPHGRECWSAQGPGGRWATACRGVSRCGVGLARGRHRRPRVRSVTGAPTTAPG